MADLGHYKAVNYSYMWDVEACYWTGFILIYQCFIKIGQSFKSLNRILSFALQRAVLRVISTVTKQTDFEAQSHSMSLKYDALFHTNDV